MEFGPIFDIFNGFMFQTVWIGVPHAGHTYETWSWPFFYVWVNRSWLGMAKNGPFWTKNGQTWQACQRSKVVQKGPEGTKMVNLSLFDHLGPFWAHLDPFGPSQTKIMFCSQRKKKGLDSKWVPNDLPCLAIFCPKWTIFGPSPVMNGRPQSEKIRLIIMSFMCGLLVEPQIFPFGT